MQKDFLVNKTSLVETNFRIIEVIAERLAFSTDLNKAEARCEDPSGARGKHDAQTEVNKVSDGIDTTSSAPYARCKNYSEEKASTGLLWWDLVPGEENPAGLITKQVRDLTEFTKKNVGWVVSGSSPEVYMSAKTTSLCSLSFTPMPTVNGSILAGWSHGFGNNSDEGYGKRRLNGSLFPRPTE